MSEQPPGLDTSNDNVCYALGGVGWWLPGLLLWQDVENALVGPLLVEDP